MQQEQELSEAGQWYRNRDEWVRHVVSRPYITDAQKMVGIFIAMHMNRRDNHTKHQQATIAKDISLSLITVKRAIKKLRDEGLIDREQVQRGRRNRAVNHYRLIFAWE